MSANNELLRALHMERLQRQEQAEHQGQSQSQLEQQSEQNNVIMQEQEQDQDQDQEQEQDQSDDAFECPVCYTDGATTGLVTPVCGHKVCLGCYSTMLLGGRGMLTKCPCCRQKYLVYDGEQEEDQEQDDYAGMPPLISQSEVHDIYAEPAFNNQAAWHNNLIAVSAEQNALQSAGRSAGSLYWADNDSTAAATAAAVAAIATLSNDRQILTLNTIAEFINEMNQIQIESIDDSSHSALASLDSNITLPNQRTMN